MTAEEFKKLEERCCWDKSELTSDMLSARLEYAVESLERMTEEEKDAEAKAMRKFFDIKEE